MNRILCALTVWAICVTGASAQAGWFRYAEPRDWAFPIAVKPLPSGTTRVAVINLGYILTKYERAAVFKEEIAANVKTVQEEAKKLTENLNLWQASLQKNDFKNGTKEQYEEKIIQGRRRLEDLSRSVGARVGKMQQTQLLTLWSDVQEAVKTYSTAQGIDLVLMYGEPATKDAMTYPNIDRKLRGADQGGAVPFFMTPGVDISEAVVELLNQRYRDGKEKAAEESSDK